MSRSQMAGFEKRSKCCPSDLTDEEWLFIQPFLPRLAKRGRKLARYLRDVLDALRYLARIGGGWRMLPNDFPPWQTVYWGFRRFVRRPLFRTIHDVTLVLDRECEKRKQRPTAAVVDSQSIKGPAATKRGFDAGKKVLGRKRQIAVGTDG
ncbi:transposase [Novosphingobium sp. Leaf2]|uniref:transposase n=1 Tax=Novosphingobium sp. Leaf2 TaxID=1735670 RepID=UPI00138F2B79|nr:transposase [Novosphingobium sp. Leaf2]